MVTTPKLALEWDEGDRYILVERGEMNDRNRATCSFYIPYDYFP